MACLLTKHLIAPFLRFGFSILYHSAAPIYDNVALLVSGGYWFKWGSKAQNFIRGHHILEVGFGTGHLIVSLSKSGYKVVGLDESKQMCRITAAKLSKLQSQPEQVMLVRGNSQYCPFRSAYFDTIICNFPSDYIINPKSLSEFKRILQPSGRLVILAGAWAGRRTLHARFASVLYRLIGQPSPNKIDWRPFFDQLVVNGFSCSLQWVSIKGSLVVFIIAESSYS